MIFQKASNNPILRSNPKNSWESVTVFNPAAIYLQNKVHIVYRAIGQSYVSVLGYAQSNDGINIDYRSFDPVFLAKYFSEWEHERVIYPYASGGSWIGSEDPRLTQIDNTIYMTYTAWDGYNAPGVALTSISEYDFLNKIWRWRHPVMLSKHGTLHKNWVIFPEKINGKYAILHSLSPQITIDYLDTLDLDSDLELDSYYNSAGREKHWDNWMRGIGPPPIRVDDGWLILYHAMDKNDPNRYKIGGMILNYSDPTKILYRSHCPLLEPDQDYENQGYKSGVVYVCGAVIINDTLHIYYGGADSVVCSAHANLNELLNLIKETPTYKDEDLTHSGEKYECKT